MDGRGTHEDGQNDPSVVVHRQQHEHVPSTELNEVEEGADELLSDSGSAMGCR